MDWRTEFPADLRILSTRTQTAGSQDRCEAKRQSSFHSTSRLRPNFTHAEIGWHAVLCCLAATPCTAGCVYSNRAAQLPSAQPLPSLAKAPALPKRRLFLSLFLTTGTSETKVATQRLSAKDRKSVCEGK